MSFENSKETEMKTHICTWNNYRSYILKKKKAHQDISCKICRLHERMTFKHFDNVSQPDYIYGHEMRDYYELHRI